MGLAEILTVAHVATSRERQRATHKADFAKKTFILFLLSFLSFNIILVVTIVILIAILPPVYLIELLIHI